MGFFDVLKEVVSTTVECLPVVGTVVSAVKTGVALYKGDYKGAAMEAIGLLPFGKIASKVGKAAYKVANKFAPKLLKKGSAVLAKALNAFNGSKLGQMLGKASDKANAAGEAAKNAVKKALKKIVNSPRISAGLARKIKKSSVKTAASGVQKIADGAKELLQSKMSQMKNAIKQKLSNIKSMKKAGSGGKGGNKGSKGSKGGGNNKNVKVEGNFKNNKKIDNKNTKTDKPKTPDKNTKTDKPKTPDKNTKTDKPKTPDKNTGTDKPKTTDKPKDTKQDKPKQDTKVCEEDPINVVTGSFDVESVDLVVEDIGPEIKLERVYDSRDTSIGVMGRGWSFNYETRILRENDEIIIVMPHGDYETYVKENETWTNIIKTDKRKVLKEYDNKYELIIKNKVTYTYDKEGKLISISDRNNNITKIDYIDNQIKTITSPEGNVNHLHIYRYRTYR